jgi:hypothetical protein
MKVIGTYSFLPWLRQGVANTIASPDNDSSVKTRARISVSLQLTGKAVAGGAGDLTQPISQEVSLYGPGDIVGIDARAVVRTEPRNWVTNFESNYLPAIDFYDEDFVWRYTPAAPDGTGLHLRPWLALIALTEDEFKDGPATADRPSPFVTVANPASFPPADQLWAWAHVHCNQSLGANQDELVSTDMDGVLGRLQSMLGGNPDLAYSRLMCPRRLDDNTGYHMFVIPTFETGRLGGLGLNPDDAPHATFSAWAHYDKKEQEGNYPYYYRWFFKTGSHGDFEYLVSLLKPQPVDPHVGSRDMDVLYPGSNIPAITNTTPPGVLLLGGALRVPDDALSQDDQNKRNADEGWANPYPQPFQSALAKFINLQDDYRVKKPSDANSDTKLGPGTDDDPDPLITAPLYGQWHSLTQRLLYKRDGSTADNSTNWVHRLNLDPHFRVPAAFGADVVETNAEEYMNDAWEQIGDVLAANARIRRWQLAKEVSWRWHTQSLQPMTAANQERALMVMAPVARRVMSGPATVASLAVTSLVPPVYTSTVMRRAIRPGSRLMTALPFNATVTQQNLLSRVNSGAVTAAPPKTVPPGVPTLGQAVNAAIPPGTPAWLLDLLAKYPWLTFAVFGAALVIALLLAFIPGGLIFALLVLAAGLYATYLLNKWKKAGEPAQSIQENNQTPATVDTLPKSPDFVLSEPGSSFRPSTGTTDSATAVRFKAALRDSYSLVAATAALPRPPVPIAVDLASLTSTMVKAVDPQVTIPLRALSTISIPDWVRQQMGDQFGEVMAYPKIDLPMYCPLKGLSDELFLPNINLIPVNSITLVETNQKFIESYMVGLNHEFARKLLWREYPTDQRGSYFRQFWDVSGYFNADNLPPDQLKEKLYDIPELHRWALNTDLGQHNNREAPDHTGEQAVLVIRGELLKKYPTAVVYAHHAQWGRTKDNAIDLTQSRSLQDIDDAFEDHPPHDVVRTPLFEAKVDPDIYFFGFDLTVPEAKGGNGQNPNDDPGWFFVIKQRPGEPRFGLELNRPTAQAEVFDEVTWDDASAGIKPGAFLQASELTTVTLADPDSTEDKNSDKKDQHADDAAVDPAQASAARWAYLLFRAPVMVAVHADEMLKDIN